MSWQGENQLRSLNFQCGFCGNTVATDKGFFSKNDSRFRLYICPHCDRPTFFDSRNQVPGVAPGRDVSHVPKALEAVYNEARRCVSIGAYTSSVLSCRKLLMHIAVQQNAEPGKTFLHYVEYLASNGYVPPNGKSWVDHIRKKGNEATHEIVLMSQEDANELIL